MAISAPNLSEFSGPIFNGSADVWVARNHSTGYGQSNLEDGGSRYIGPSQFIHESVAVRVRAVSETFFGLDSVMVVECIVSELADRDNVAGLMIRPNDEVRRCTARSSSSRRCQ